MAEPEQRPSGPDMRMGVASADLADGAMLLGHVGDDAVLLARASGEVFAVDGLCTHYHAPLDQGLMVGATVRCPWHHARFCLRTGEATGAPAFDALGPWRVEESDGMIRVTGRLPAQRRRATPTAGPDRVIIIGGGAAGFAAAERLRRDGYGGELSMFSDDVDPPYDRPNLSKDYLAGKAPDAWMPLRDRAWYETSGIDLNCGVPIAEIDVRQRRVSLQSGERRDFDALILATGATPVRPSVSGFDDARVFVLRTWRDCAAIIRAAERGRQAVVVGASFIGLEVSAALILRGLRVHVIAPETAPLTKILGPDLGRFIQGLHEEKGVVFHLGQEVEVFEDGHAVLQDGTRLAADFVVVGAGVRPRAELAAAAGLRVDGGVVVDARLETAAPGIFAAGDVARYPDPRTGELMRVEHWLVAERQGQHVAKVLLGQADAYTDTPFFWSAHYEEAVHYMGHAPAFDATRVEGVIADHDATVRYLEKGRVLAAATVGRDLESLRIERDFEAG